MSGIAYYMDWDQVLQEIQLTFDKVDSLFSPFFDS